MEQSNKTQWTYIDTILAVEAYHNNKKGVELQEILGRERLIDMRGGEATKKSPQFILQNIEFVITNGKSGLKNASKKTKFITNLYKDNK